MSHVFRILIYLSLPLVAPLLGLVITPDPAVNHSIVEPVSFKTLICHPSPPWIMNMNTVVKNNAHIEQWTWKSTMRF